MQSELIADVLESQDYYPFGMVMPGMSYQGSEDYRYGFNCMEQDDEVKGNDNSIDFGARMYNPRIGRWFSTDPLEKKFPFASTYAFTVNNPIVFYDVDGRTIDPINSKGLAQFRKAMLHTNKGTDIYNKLIRSDGIFVVRVVDEVLLYQGSIVGGLADHRGELRKGGTSEAYWYLTII